MACSTAAGVLASAPSCKVCLVISPGSDDGVGGEVGLGFGAGVAPAQVVGDGGALFGVAGVVGAVQGEVAQRGELGLDPVQPRGVGRQEHQLDVVLGGPGAYVRV